MKGKLFMILALGISVWICSSPAFAHHGNAAYDTDKKVTLKGTVALWVWANPHVIIKLDVTDANSQVVHWFLETENPSSMIRLGWTNQSLKPGDQISATVLPVKNGNPVGRVLEVVLPNGQTLAGRGNLETPKPEDSSKQ